MRSPTSHLILTINSILAGLLLTVTTSATSPASHEDELLRNATLAFEHAVEAPVSAIPVVVLMRATGIAVIPAASNNGTRFYGDGVVSARGGRADAWTPPAVISFEGAIPLNLESSAVDLILVAQTQRGLDYFLQGRFASTAADAMVAGPLKHNRRERTAADLFAYVLFDNHFAGVMIDDWVLRDVRTSNAVLYGRPYSTDDIVRDAGFFHIQGAVRAWRNALQVYFREMS